MKWFNRRKKLPVEGFASKEDISDWYKYQETSLLLGNISSDHGLNFKAGVNDDMGFFVMAGSRSGKGTSFIIPNLIEWPGGVFCIDPKGENASITAIRRGTKEIAAKSGSSVKNVLNQKVAILDPFNTVKGPARAYRVNYNPLLDIDLNSDEVAANILTIAESIVFQDGSNSGQHFTETVETLLAGIIETVLFDTDDEDNTRDLPYCLEKLQLDRNELNAYLNIVKTDAGLAHEAASLLIDVGEDEFGSVRTTFSRQLRFMLDPRMKEHLGSSDFSLTQAIAENGSVYVCIPPNKIKRANRWLRMITNTALDAKMNKSFVQEGARTLFILDEFAALGNMSLIEEASAYMAGYGIKLIPIIQNIGQIKKNYPKNWETFLSNAGAVLAWGMNDLESQKYISDQMGSIWVDESSMSVSVNNDGQTGKSGGSQTRSISKQQRAVRWPNEIHHQGARQHNLGFVISASTPPFMIERLAYFDTYKTTHYDDPADIAAWERNRE